MRVTYDGRRYISIMNLVRQINENNITFTTSVILEIFDHSTFLKRRI